MSWSVGFIGKAANVAAALAAASDKMSGQSKDEYDSVKDSLVNLVQKNFSSPGNYGPQVVKINANGSGTTIDGKLVGSSCYVAIDPVYSEFVGDPPAPAQ